jgi:hypothetical protein
VQLTDWDALLQSMCDFSLPHVHVLSWPVHTHTINHRDDNTQSAITRPDVIQCLAIVSADATGAHVLSSVVARLCRSTPLEPCMGLHDVLCCAQPTAPCLFNPNITSSCNALCVPSGQTLGHGTSSIHAVVHSHTRHVHLTSPHSAHVTSPHIASHQIHQAARRWHTRRIHLTHLTRLT